MADEGVIANIEEIFRNTLAECPTILDWSRNNLPLIYEEADPRKPQHRDEFSREEWIENRPFIVVYSLEFRDEFVATPGTYVPSGEMEAMFEMNAPTNATNADVFKHFKRFMGSVIKDMNLLARRSEEVWLLTTRKEIHGPERSAPESHIAVGDFLRYYLRVQWGVKP